MKKTIVIVSGYFNPLHKGHLEYFKQAKSHGDLLYVIVNNDNQRIHYNLQNARKFDFNQLKALKSKEYVKKITV